MQHSALKWIYFLILVHYNFFFKMANFWSFLAPFLGEIETRTTDFFCMKFNSKQLSFETFLCIIGNFCSIQPWSESIFPFYCVIIFSKMAYLWSSLALLLGEIEIRARWLFCRKFYFWQVLFEEYFDINSIFCSLQLID